ncbi:YcnI family copper-binding membrane protein [Nocardia testacea]|uniref:YcnI family copper-binding membrane protein n=1 Tax=Nocardia testacea TaxID=248551 RepID=UPI0033FDC4DC
MAERHVSAAVRPAAAGALLALVLLVQAPSAAAHVRSDPGSAPARGGYGTATFQVPTESRDASTIGLEFTFSGATEFTSLRTQPVPGWTARIERGAGGTVERVLWRADDPSHALAPDEFGAFTISAGPWPEAESVAVPVAQHYSDGAIVEWNERALDEHAEVAHPAPVVQLGAADGGDEHGGAAAETEHAAHTGSGTGTGVATGVSIASLLIAAAALGYAGLVHRRLRSR